jgi:outer membrane protein
VLNLKTVTAFVLCMLMSAWVSAQSKVVVFNFERAILSTEAAQKASAALNADPEFASLQAKYESLVAELQGLREEQQTKGITWNADQQTEHRKQVEYKRADLELAQKKLQAEQNAAVRGLLQEFEEKTKAALNEVIEAEGITIVLNASQAYYAGASADITAKVTDKLNKSN